MKNKTRSTLKQMHRIRDTSNLYVVHFLIRNAWKLPEILLAGAGPRFAARHTHIFHCYHMLSEITRKKVLKTGSYCTPGGITIVSITSASSPQRHHHTKKVREHLARNRKLDQKI